MDFAKTTFLSFFTTGLKLLNGLLLVKLISLYIGPEGLARTGQFVSFVSFLVLFAGGGINQGIIKYVSEYMQDAPRLKAILGAGQYVMLSTTLICFIFIILFRKYLSLLLFNSENFTHIIIFIAFGQIFMAFSNFLTSIINGFKDILKLSIVNLLGIGVGGITSIVLTIYYGFEGVLVAYIFSQSFLFIFSAYFCFKIKGFHWEYIFPKFNKKDTLLLVKFSIMSVVSSLLTNLVQFLIRNHLANELSWVEVGYWEGVVKISDAYIVLITTLLSVYCLPTLSAIQDRRGITQELMKIFKLIIPLTCILAFSIFLLRDFIIMFLFSPEFMGMRSLFFWQLIGDVFRVLGMVFAYFLLSKALIKTFIFIELTCSLVFLLLVYILTNIFGLEGAIYAFAINTVFFVLLVFSFSLKKLSSFGSPYRDRYMAS